MAYSREGALEHLRATVEAVAGMKSCTRYVRNRDEVEPDGFPFAFIAEVTGRHDQNIGPRYQETLTTNLEVHVSAMSPTDLEAFRILVYRAILADLTRGNTADSTKLGDDTTVNVPPGEFGPGVQGFAVTVEIFISSLSIEEENIL